MSELKPCPFCKCKTSELARERRYCDNCDCVASEDRWNTRPIEDELRATIRKMDQEHAQSLEGKLAMVGKLEELEELGSLRKKIKRAESDLALLSISLDHSNQVDPVIRLVNESVKKTLARIRE